MNEFTIFQSAMPMLSSLNVWSVMMSLSKKVKINKVKEVKMNKVMVCLMSKRLLSINKSRTVEAKRKF